MPASVVFRMRAESFSAPVWKCAAGVHARLTRRPLWLGVQTIKTWYKLMPDMLGKKLAQRKQLGGALSEEKRQNREQETEASLPCLLPAKALDPSLCPFLG